MEPITIAVLSVGVIFALILFGIHIGVALGLTSVLGLWLITGKLRIAIAVLGTTSYSAVMDYVFAIVPLFVLMGLCANRSGATGDLFSAAQVTLGRVRGGVGIATVAANAVFAAITGVSVASAAVFSRIAIPEMRKLEYNSRFSYGIIAASSLLGMLIPPSILMIVYGVLTEQSIGALFLAGVGPGLLVGSVLALGIWLMVLRWPHLGGRIAGAREEVHRSNARIFLRPWGVYLLIVTVLGGMYGGFFTPTEAGAIGAAGGVLLVIGRRQFSWASARDILMETARTTASIFLLLMAAQMYGRMLAISGLAAKFSQWAVGLPVDPIVLIVAFILVFLLLGAIIDSISIMLLTIPIVFPVVQSLGYDPIWFGIVTILAVEIGLLTPPFGMSVFAMKAALGDEARIEDIFIGAMPFLGLLMIALALIVAFPPIATWLPRFVM